MSDTTSSHDGSHDGFRETPVKPSSKELFTKADYPDDKPILEHPFYLWLSAKAKETKGKLFSTNDIELKLQWLLSIGFDQPNQRISPNACAALGFALSTAFSAQQENALYNETMPPRIETGQANVTCVPSSRQQSGVGGYGCHH